MILVHLNLMKDFLFRKYFFNPILILSISITVFFTQNSFAQNNFPDNGVVFKDDELANIQITLDPDSLLLLYNNIYGNYNFPCTFIFQNSLASDTIYNAGIGLRGNTSLQSAKKSFQITFNALVPGQKYHGLSKMNLNGEHNDPCIIRSKICWDMLRNFGVPAPRANHVKVYINGNYYGLYINVENINDDFVQSRFGNENGNLYKCLYGSDLTWLGNNQSAYETSNYELKTNELTNDRSDLIHFIDVLNNTPISDLQCELEKVLNVDNMIRCMAFDVLSGNWDGPLYNKNNFFLYKNTFTNKFEYIPYDLDNTLGIDWLGQDWGIRNIYNWIPNGQPRPLYEKILAVPEYNSRFTYYITKFIDQYFNEAFLFPRIDTLKSKIQTAAEQDIYRTLDWGFTINDFNTSFTQALGNQVAYGLKDYISVRIFNATQQLNTYNLNPIITQYIHSYPGSGDNLFISAFVEDDNLQTVSVKYIINSNSQQTLTLYDDGLHNDGDNADYTFANSISGLTSGDAIFFHIESNDGSGNSISYPRCIDDLIYVNPITPDLVINEFMTSNNTSLQDNYFEYDDWVELYNYGNTTIQLGNKFLTDDINNRTQYQLPDIQLLPNKYILIWCDKDGWQGENHAGFKLSSASGNISLIDGFDNSLAIIDSVNYNQQTSDISSARVPNGTGSYVFQSSTPQYNNELVSVKEINVNNIIIYPNPVSAGNNLYLNSDEDIISIKISDLVGKEIYLIKSNISINKLSIPSSIINGIYFVECYSKDSTGFRFKLNIN
jgi:spore coat protein H